MAPVIPFPQGEGGPQPRRPGACQRRVHSQSVPGQLPARASALVAYEPNEPALIESLRAAREGQERLFVEIERHVRLVATRFFGRQHDLVDDCVQESLQILNRCIGHLDPARNVVAYIKTVTRHEASRIYRRLRALRGRGCDLDEALTDESEFMASDPQPLEAAVRAERVQVVRAKVDLLPPDYRDVVALKMRGASIKETAGLLGIPHEGTVRAKLSRAYAMLRNDPEIAAVAA